MTKIISLNIRTLYRDTKRQSEHWWVERYRKIHDYIKEQNPDVICLQEVWWPAKYVLKLGKLGYKKTGWGFSHPIFVRKSAKVSKRAVSVFSTMAIVDGVQYFSVHAHWEEKLFQRAMRRIKKQQMRARWIKSCIACGDFNRTNRDSIHKALKWLSSVRDGRFPVDTFQNYKHPESCGEIDHFFANGCVVVYSYFVGQTNLSDHQPIVLTFKSN